MDGTWSATRRASNPRLSDHPPEQLPIDVPEATTSADSAAAAATTTAAIILARYASNIGVLLLNKYLLSYYGYRFPIFLTLLHMLACSAYSYAAVHFAGIVPRQPVRRRGLLKIAALSAVFCFSVVSGNTSLRYLPVSFNQAVGAATPFFTAVFALFLTCRRESPAVYLSLLPVVLGIVLASNSEPLFHFFGFLVCLGSTAGRALKSVVQYYILYTSSK